MEGVGCDVFYRGTENPFLNLILTSLRAEIQT
jgi:hypothetical protein